MRSIAPIGEEEFVSDMFLARRHAHFEGNPNGLSDLMDWERLDQIVASTYGDPQVLRVYSKGEPFSNEEYMCSEGPHGTRGQRISSMATPLSEIRLERFTEAPQFQGRRVRGRFPRGAVLSEHEGKLVFGICGKSLKLEHKFRDMIKMLETGVPVDFNDLLSPDLEAEHAEKLLHILYKLQVVDIEYTTIGFSTGEHLQMFRPSLTILAVLVLSIMSLAAVSNAFGQSKVKVAYFNVEVPLDHRRPKGETIKLSVARISKKPNQSNLPLIYLAGGPGETSIRSIAKRYENGGWRFELIAAALNDRDVIVFDQRGSGQSDPNLRCRFKEPVHVRPPYNYAAHEDAGVRAAKKCLDLLPIEKAKLQFFNTWQSARDVDSIRQHLKLEKILLLGHSYGSHLALAYLRHFGQHTERAVLAAVEGPDHTYKLPSQYDVALDRVDGYRQTIGLPKLRPLFESVLARFKSEGTISVASFDETSARIAALDVSNFEAQRYLLRSHPSWLYEFWASKDYSSLSGLTRKWRRWRGFNAMFYAMDCASGASTERLAEIERQKSSALIKHINFLPREICETLGISVLSAAFRAPFSSTVPVLMMAGDLDHKTPSENAREVARSFKDALIVIYKKGRHGMCRRPKCLELFSTFLLGKREPNGIEEIEVE